MNTEYEISKLKERIEELENALDNLRSTRPRKIDSSTFVSVAALAITTLSGLIATATTNFTRISTLEIRQQYLGEAMIEMRKDITGLRQELNK